MFRKATMKFKPFHFFNSKVNTPLRRRLLTHLTVTGVSFFAIEKMDQIRGLQYLKKYEKSKENEDLSVRHKTMIVKQAFQDMDVTWPVHVIFDPEVKMKIAQTFNALNSSYQKIIFVIIHPEFNSYQQLYAVSGHEAVHALHNHRLLSTLIDFNLLICIQRSLLNVNKFVTLHVLAYLCALYFTDKFINRLMEKDADITSVKKLGTASVFCSFLDFYGEVEAIENIKKDNLGKIFVAGYELFCSHPLATTRKKYLSKLSGSCVSTLFESEAWRTIMRERNSDNCQIEKTVDERVKRLS